MPFEIPTFRDVRDQNRASITAAVGSVLIPNDYPRALADANAANAHLNIQYLENQSLQFLPLTAEGIWLDRLADIYLINSDGSLGRKAATYASGTATIVADIVNTTMIAGTTFVALNGSSQIVFSTLEDVVVSTTPTSFSIRSLTPGTVANLDAGTSIRIVSAVPGLLGNSTIITNLEGGTDEESDDLLRARLLLRYRNPPMSGDANDYVQWAFNCPGVTRAWCAPNEMGPGSLTLRIMMDGLRATNNPMTSGIPTPDDLASVKAYIDTVRPVTVRDLFVLAPIPVPINFTVLNLNKNTISTQTAIIKSVGAMIFSRARPATAVNGSLTPASTIYRAWISDAVLSAVGVNSFDLDPTFVDYVPANNGCIAVLGSIKYANS